MSYNSENINIGVLGTGPYQTRMEILKNMKNMKNMKRCESVKENYNFLVKSCTKNSNLNLHRTLAFDDIHNPKSFNVHWYKKMN